VLWLDTSYLWSEKPSPLSFLGLFGGVGLVIIVGFIFGLVVSPGFFWLSLFGLVVGVLMVVVAVERAYSTLYVVSFFGVCRKQTYPTYRIEALPFNVVANITISSGVFGRLFGFGTLCINSSSLSYNPLVLTGVRKPQALRRLIVAAKENAQKN